MPAATATAIDTKAETRDEKGNFVCLMVGGDGPGAHDEPKVYEGADAKRKWALHRSNAHNIKSERHERIRSRTRKAETKASGNGKPTSRTAPRRRAARPSQARGRATQQPREGISYRVERAVAVRLDYEKPMLVNAVEVAEDGTLRVFQANGSISSLRTGTPFVAVPGK